MQPGGGLIPPPRPESHQFICHALCRRPAAATRHFGRNAL